MFCDQRFLVLGRRWGTGTFTDTLFPTDSNHSWHRDYQMNFNPNCISRDGVCVEGESWPKRPARMSRLATEGGKLARFRMLKNSARNCTTKDSEILGILVF